MCWVRGVEEGGRVGGLEVLIGNGEEGASEALEDAVEEKELEEKMYRGKVLV